MATTESGEDRAWELLAAREPAEVCAFAAAAFDPAAAAYRVACFGREVTVTPGMRRVLAADPGQEAWLEQHAPLLRLSVLWYLVKASGARPCGRLVRPSELPGGGLFSKGTHVLPLDALGATYATRPGDFLSRGRTLGGEPAAHGDAAIVLLPLPRVPTTVILWTADDEFPARADLLFDATAPRHLPPDIVWSVAMLSLQAFLEPAESGRP